MGSSCAASLDGESVDNGWLDDVLVFDDANTSSARSLEAAAQLDGDLWFAAADLSSDSYLWSA